ncbi:MAG: peptidase [Alphaproteobacteria bacterium]
MTYCVALNLDSGLVLLADTRTNAGIDNISTFRKMFTWAVPGERAIALLTSGNLAITQAVVSQLQERIDHPLDGVPTLLSAATMFEAVQIVANTMRDIQTRYGPGLAAMNESALASIVVAGQRQGGVPRLFLVYSAGNFIEATEDTPFFQIGETKYGKPIIDQVLSTDLSLEAGVTLCLLSMASTMRSNLSVGMPLDVAVIPKDSFSFEQLRRIEPDNAAFWALAEAWSSKLRASFEAMRSHKV